MPMANQSPPTRCACRPGSTRTATASFGSRPETKPLKDHTMKTAIAALSGMLLLTACQTPSQEGAQMGVRVNDVNAPNARVMFDQVVILDKSLQSSKAGKVAV